MDPWRVIRYTSYTIYLTLVLVVFFIIIYLFGIYLFGLIKKKKSACFTENVLT